MKTTMTLMEYLFAGSLVLFWVFYIFPETILWTMGPTLWFGFVLLPLIFVFGILIDFLALSLIHYFKVDIQKGAGLTNPRQFEIAVLLASTDLHGIYHLQSSRDRILRCFLTHLILFLIIVILVDPPQNFPLPQSQLLLVIFILTLVCFIGWYKFENQSTDYLVEAYRQTAVQKHKHDASGDT